MTRARLSRLLGLEPSPVFYRVEGVRWVQDHLEVVVCPVNGGDAIDFVIEARRSGGEAFLQGQEVSLWARQTNVPPELAKRLRRIGARNIQRLRIEDMYKAVLLDPDVVAEPVPPAETSSRASSGASSRASSRASPGPPPDGISIPSAAEQAFTHPIFFADFFAAAELRRAGCDIIDVHTAHTLVCHGDVECSYCAVAAPRPRNGLLRLPVYERVRNIGRMPRGIGSFDESEDLTDITCSDMTEQDVILGSSGKLEKALRHSDRTRKRESLMVIGLCLPDVIGENEEAVVQSYAAKTKTPLLMVPASPRSWNWLARDMLATRRAPYDKATCPDAAAINLIGFGRNRGTMELCDRLKALGISVNVQVLPELAMQSIQRLHRASLNVYLPNVYWEKAYAHLQQDRGRAHILLDGPYGCEGSIRWLEGVCEALRMQVDVPFHARSWAEPINVRWERLRAVAREHRLGLVVSNEDLDALFDCRFTWGVPLKDFLSEMGFSLDIFVGGTVGEDANSLGSLRQRLRFEGTPHTLTVVDSLTGLLDALERSPCEAVFSNYVFDWRLIRCGKMPFSNLELEMGFEGAVASLERMITVCRTPLFQGGRRFFRNTAPPGWTHGA